MPTDREVPYAEAYPVPEGSLQSQIVTLARQEGTMWFVGTSTRITIDPAIWAEWDYPEQIRVTIEKLGHDPKKCPVCAIGGTHAD